MILSSQARQSEAFPSFDVAESDWVPLFWRVNEHISIHNCLEKKGV